MMKRAVFLLFPALLFIAGCSGGGATRQAAKEPALLQALPASYEGYDYRGYKVYPTEALGYSVRYAKRDEPFHYADIYIYPVPAGSSQASQRDSVMAATRASAGEIEEAGRQGYYSQIKVLGGAMLTHQGDVMTRSEFAYVYSRNNLRIYSLLYLTESGGTLIKARVSMPYDQQRLEHADEDRFLAHLFGIIKKELN